MNEWSIIQFTPRLVIGGNFEIDHAWYIMNEWREYTNFLAKWPMKMMTSSKGNIFRVTGLCVGNSPVTGEFPSRRPVTHSFDVFFDLHLYKRLSKQSRGWWFETPSLSLWCHCNGIFSLQFAKVYNNSYCDETNNRGYSGIAIPILEIRRSHYRLIFIMRIHISSKTIFILKRLTG